MNILLTSVGRRSYLIKYFKEIIGECGEVHVGNSTSNIPSFAYADKNVVTPLIIEDEYIPFIKRYCIENNIKAIIPLFDIDVTVLSKKRMEFLESGIIVVVSSEDVVNICNDKWMTYKYLMSNNIKVPGTYINIEPVMEDIENKKIKFPLIIKPRFGMGSIGVFEADNVEELKVLYKKVLSQINNSYIKYLNINIGESTVIIQEKICGQEYGLDIINNLEGEYQNTIVKKKYSMRSGETDCAEIVNFPELKELGEKISAKLNHIGNLDVDIFIADNNIYVLELNARFGGGYPFSHMAGVNLPMAIIKWLKNEDLDINILTERIGEVGHKDIDIVNITRNCIMNEQYVTYKLEDYDELVNIFNSFEYLLKPPILNKTIDIRRYVEKIYKNAIVVVGKEKYVLGVVAIYVNDSVSFTAYLTFMAVHTFARRGRIGTSLMNKCIDIAKRNSMKKIKLEVSVSNTNAIDFYTRNGFEYDSDASNHSIYMIRRI